jgi:hypothetical protein
MWGKIHEMAHVVLFLFTIVLAFPTTNLRSTTNYTPKLMMVDTVPPGRAVVEIADVMNFRN